jgi:hypothetical protein
MYEQGEAGEVYVAVVCGNEPPRSCRSFAEAFAWFMERFGKALSRKVSIAILEMDSYVEFRAKPGDMTGRRIYFEELTQLATEVGLFDGNIVLEDMGQVDTDRVRKAFTGEQP